MDPKESPGRMDIHEKKKKKAEAQLIGIAEFSQLRWARLWVSWLEDRTEVQLTY